MLILVTFLGFWPKQSWGALRGKITKLAQVVAVELLGSTFNQAKFHPKIKERWHVSPLPGPLANLLLNLNKLFFPLFKISLLKGSLVTLFFPLLTRIFRGNHLNFSTNLTDLVVEEVL